MNYFLKVGLVALATMGAQSSHASSPGAWNDLYQQTAHACLAKSELKKARIIEGPAVFSHAVLYRIKGTWPQPHMRGKVADVYCLHPYPKGTPEIVERPAK